MNETQWHYMSNGAQQAPVSDDQLRQMARDGQLQQTDLVWHDGMPQWVPAANITGLFPASRMPPTLPPMPIGYYPAGAPGYPPRRDIGQDAGMRMLLPVGRSGFAIVAGYLGLISVCGLPGPLAIIFALLAFNDMKKHPERHGMGRAIFGLIMGILGTVGLIIGIIGNLVH